MDEQEFRQHADTFGLGELTNPEIEHLIAHDIYNWYAVEPQMPGDVVADNAATWRTLKATSTKERLEQIEKFQAWLEQNGWCDHDWEVIWDDDEDNEQPTPGAVDCRVCMKCGIEKIFQH